MRVNAFFVLKALLRFIVADFSHADTRDSGETIINDLIVSADDEPASHERISDQVLMTFKENSRSGVYTLAIVNHGIEKHHSTIQLGSPPQTFTVGLDTGSANLWVPGLGCHMHKCSQLQKYNSSASSSYQANGTKFELEYGPPGPNNSASVVGFVSQDILTIAGLEVEGQGFAEATGGSALGRSETDGIFGMGFAIAAVNKIVPPFYHLMARQLLDEPAFAFYFGDIDNSDDDRSEVTLGGINHNHYDGELVKLPVRRIGTWEVTINKISLGDTSVDMNDTGASIDTGMGLLGVPRKVAESLNIKMGAKRNADDGLYEIACEQRAFLPNLTFTFSDHDFSIAPGDYIFETKDRCKSAVVAVDFDQYGPSVVLGPIFLRKWYSVFNFSDNTISLARARQQFRRSTLQQCSR